MEDVAGTANATVANGSQITGSSTVVLLVERQDRTLAGLVGVASSANAAEEAARGSNAHGRVRRLGVRRLGGTGDVSGTATARTDVGGGGGSGLSDDVVGHGDGGDGYGEKWVVVVRMYVAGCFISGVKW